MNKRFLFLLAVVPLCAAAALPYTFQSGQTISAAEINANFNYLNSRIDALSTAASGSVTTKVGSLPVLPQPPVVIVSNTGTAPIEILDAVFVGQGRRWFIACGSATFGAFEPPPRFVPPGCALQGQVTIGSPQDGYVVTYRQ